MKPATSCLLLSALVAAPLSTGAVLYSEEFDGNTNGYNVNSTTALAGDNDWVDFNNRITTAFNGGEGYQTEFGGTATVLAGAASTNDPQVRSDFGFAIPKADVTGFELRLRIDVNQNNAYDDTLNNGNFDLFWGDNQYLNPGAGNVGSTNFNANAEAAPTLTVQSNGWYLVNWDFAAGTLDSGAIDANLDSIRIDPGNVLLGSSFEIDYFRITGVPEPASASLLALGLAGLALRRRR